LDGAQHLCYPGLTGPLLFAGVAVDITDRNRAAEELRRSEASLAQAQEISRTGSWRRAVGTGEVSPSAEFLHIFGFNPLSMQVSYGTFMQRVHRMIGPGSSKLSPTRRTKGPPSNASIGSSCLMAR
jgi:PAS domain-containing protein